jgi:nicotinamidase-related amidase
MKEALIILDAQVNMFAEATAAYDADRLLERLVWLIAQARQSHLPVFYVQHNGSPGSVDEPGTPGWEIHPALAPQPGE